MCVWLALMWRIHDSTPCPPTALPVRNDEITPQSAAGLHLRSHALLSFASRCPCFLFVAPRGRPACGTRKSEVMQAIATPSVSRRSAAPLVPEPPDPPTMTGAVYHGAFAHAEDGMREEGRESARVTTDERTTTGGLLYKQVQKRVS